MDVWHVSTGFIMFGALPAALFSVSSLGMFHSEILPQWIEPDPTMSRDLKSSIILVFSLQSDVLGAVQHPRSAGFPPHGVRVAPPCDLAQYHQASPVTLVAVLWRVRRRLPTQKQLKVFAGVALASSKDSYATPASPPAE